MADLKDLIGSKKVKEFVRKEKSRPWTVLADDVSSRETKDQVQKTEAKPRPIRGQTEAKPGTELRSNRGQTEAITSLTSDITPRNRGQTEAKPGTELRPYSRPIRGQTEAKPGTELRPNPRVSSLDGLQRNILFLIYDHCKRTREKITPPLAVEHITESCRTTYHAARKAIQRLEQKNILQRSEFKAGRSGWTKYELPESIYHELLQCETEAKLRPIRGQTEAKPGTELETELRPIASSSSSSLDINNKRLTTTEGADGSENLPPLWNELDVSPLLPIRFGRSHLVQLATAGKLTPEQVQDSIYAFAFDLEVNGKSREINGNALNYFMGILRKGPYTPPANYESVEDRQERLYLEAKEQQRKLRLEREARLETLEFEEWLEKQPLEQRALLVPPKDFAKPGGTAHNYQLREYFRETVWPALREKITTPT